ncbi:hypothetical protein [Bordetella hinzii]|uniref:hypothetical protein n=1 Tax=Bordetella hinzii TaxID=103855 RepID=UPI001152E027|nr:hypothetical protein [Bordetella hinzii]QDJ45009.1 hypothetical protein CBR71_03895 [Bordetella hinzii]
MKQEIIRLLERAKEDGRTIGDVLVEVRGIAEPVAASAEPIGYISETGFRNLVGKRDVTTISPTVASKYRIAPRLARHIPLYAAPVAAQAPIPEGQQPYPPTPAPDVQSSGEAEDSYSRAAVERAMRAAHDRGYSVGWDHGHAAQAPAAAMPDEIEGLRAHVALLKSALAQSERENDELRALAAAGDAQPAVWVAADTIHSPHPTCISSLAYMSQLDRDLGREYMPLYAAPVAAQAPRPCTCHPDDRPDGPCREKYAASECQAPAAASDARDAERYRWLRVRWGRIVDTYDGDSNRLVEIREADDRFEGWDVSPESLDAAIDAAMQRIAESLESIGGKQ